MICPYCGVDPDNITSGRCNCSTYTILGPAAPPMTPPNVAPPGWICPRCGVALSPYTTHCPMCLGPDRYLRFSTTGTTEPEEDEASSSVRPFAYGESPGPKVHPGLATVLRSQVIKLLAEVDAKDLTTCGEVVDISDNDERGGSLIRMKIRGAFDFKPFRTTEGDRPPTIVLEFEDEPEATP